MEKIKLLVPFRRKRITNDYHANIRHGVNENGTDTVTLSIIDVSSLSNVYILCVFVWFGN